MRLLDQYWRVGAGCHAEGRGLESHHPLLKSAAKVEISSSAQKTPFVENQGFGRNSTGRREAEPLTLRGAVRSKIG
jgi:hypothetical protein